MLDVSSSQEETKKGLSSTRKTLRLRRKMFGNSQGTAGAKDPNKEVFYNMQGASRTVELSTPYSSKKSVWCYGRDRRSRWREDAGWALTGADFFYFLKPLLPTRGSLGILLGGTQPDSTQTFWKEQRRARTQLFCLASAKNSQSPTL
eukprot:TRINITY_DN32840_c0_g1_i2.p1 TRINITY_DN32840_c0_g1~~TRINITY_DN32840_c0_g1_i2.p1  ORF type:complete len:147 (-),score=11.34 TRINITY_DN32840_c0_g1_i2:658-1098(-)